MVNLQEINHYSHYYGANADHWLRQFLLLLTPICSRIGNGLMETGQILNNSRVRHRIVIILHGTMIQELMF
jgi:hypothetical protein